jgi:hypothetical protein
MKIFLYSLVFFFPFFVSAQTPEVLYSHIPVSGSDTLPTVTAPQNEDFYLFTFDDDFVFTEIRLPSRNTDRCSYTVSLVDDSDDSVIGTATLSQFSQSGSYTTDTSLWNIYDFSSLSVPSGSYRVETVGTSCPFTGGTRGYSFYSSGNSNPEKHYVEGGINGDAIYEIYGYIPVPPPVPLPLYVKTDVASTTCINTASGTECVHHYVTSTSTSPVDDARHLFYGILLLVAGIISSHYVLRNVRYTF